MYFNYDKKEFMIIKNLPLLTTVISTYASKSCKIKLNY